MPRRFSALLVFLSGAAVGVGAAHVEWGGARAEASVSTQLAPVSGQSLSSEPVSPEPVSLEPVSPEHVPPEEVAQVAPRPDDDSTRLERSFRSAVSVRAGRAFGAGVLVADGAVLTAYHVVEGEPSVRVRFDDSEWMDAAVVATDTPTDLAVLRLDGPSPHSAPPSRSATELRLAEALLSVGSPRELGFSVQRGIVSRLERRFGDARYVQTDLPANPGSSGGPVFDEEGRLIGVMSFVLRDSEGIAFVTPIDAAAPVLARADVHLTE